MKSALTVFLSISALCAAMRVDQTFSYFGGLARASSAGQVVPHERPDLQTDAYERIARATPPAHGTE